MSGAKAKARKGVEKPYNSGRWSSARYWGWVRSGLRKMSMRWPPLNECLKNARRPLAVKIGNQRWEYQCAMCKEWFARKQVERDHIRPTGSLRSRRDVARFVATLFCELDNLRVLCKNCHEKRKEES